MILLLTSPVDKTIGQTTLSLGSKPSKRAEIAMPLAKCIWKQRYVDALAFANDLERGLQAKVALDRLSALQQSCSDLSVEGDVIAAIAYSRQAAVADCLARKAAEPFRAFRKITRRETVAAKHFVEKGFPENLKAAAAECDVTLTYDFAQSERTDFGGRVLGWW
jgi:hypothetical protein